MVQIHYRCTEENCKFSNVWCSQPFSNGKMPVGNLLLSSSILLTGESLWLLHLFSFFTGVLVTRYLQTLLRLRLLVPFLSKMNMILLICFKLLQYKVKHCQSRGICVLLSQEIVPPKPYGCWTSWMWRAFRRVPTTATLNPMLIPPLYKSGKTHQQHLLGSLGGQENGLVLAGDGRCDSPGYSAKFGSYTLLEQQTNRVLDFEVVQVSSPPLPRPHISPQPSLFCLVFVHVVLGSFVALG